MAKRHFILCSGEGVKLAGIYFSVPLFNSHFLSLKTLFNYFYFFFIFSFVVSAYLVNMFGEFCV